MSEPAPPKNRRKLLAVDPSLTASGWALFCAETSQLLAAGVISPPPPSVLLAERLKQLQGKITSIIESVHLSTGDILVCEGPAPLVDNPQSAIKVEHVRGIFETVARARQVEVPGRLHPRTVQSELLGVRGAQIPRKLVKSVAREVAERLYPKEVQQLAEGRKGRVSQDIIDAILIGVAAVARVQRSRATGEDLQTIFAHRKSQNGWREENVYQREGREQKTRRNSVRRCSF